MISSKSNNTVKQIRNLQQRKERERTGLFYIEGIRIVMEAVQQGIALEKLVVAPNLLTSSLAQEMVETQRRQGVDYLEVSADVLKSLSSREKPQGIGAVVRQRWMGLAEIQPTTYPFWVALYKTQDPGNLGTILRTSDAVGCAGVILVDNTTDPYDGASVRASMGAIFSQRIVQTNFAEFIAWKQRHHYSLIGTSDHARDDYRSVAYDAPLILFMGSEPQGLPLEYQSACDTMVKIPMVGRSDSLNLAVATGVILYEVFYQTRNTAQVD